LGVRRDQASATLIVRQLPRSLREGYGRDAAFVRTSASTAAEYGWHDLVPAEDRSELVAGAFSALQEQLNQLDRRWRADYEGEIGEPVLLRVVAEPWPFPPNPRGQTGPLLA
jgi:hypothetical protein